MRFTKRRIGLTAALTMLTILIGAWLLLMTPVGVRFAAALAARLEPRLRIEARMGAWPTASVLPCFPGATANSRSQSMT